MAVDLNYRLDGSGPHVLLLHAVGMDLTLLAPGSRANAVVDSPVGLEREDGAYQINVDGQQVTQLVTRSTSGSPRYSRDSRSCEGAQRRPGARAVRRRVILVRGDRTIAGSGPQCHFRAEPSDNAA